MVSFIDEHRVDYGVESICRQLPIAPSTYYEQKAQAADPERCCDRVKRDSRLEIEIQRVWDESMQVYGAKKVWRQLKREEIEVARCTVERLMKHPGIEGVRRGAKCRTTTANNSQERPADLVNR
jgi:transposase InsO family protein|tara:strand:- start:17189 stop:17560 length:372 start_codon:yes stop_codon:yes gene_type:complete